MSDVNAIKANKTLRHFGVGLLAVAALLVIFGIYFIVVANETLSWSSVQGSVVDAEIDTDVTLRTGSSAASHSYVQYFVTVRYTYQVDGTDYVSSRYSFGQGNTASDSYSDRADAETEAASRFPKGGAVTVYYDPNDPSEAVLKAGLNRGTLAPLLMGLALGAAGGLFYAVGASPRPTPPSET